MRGDEPRRGQISRAERAKRSTILIAEEMAREKLGWTQQKEKIIVE